MISKYIRNELLVKHAADAAKHNVFWYTSAYLALLGRTAGAPDDAKCLQRSHPAYAQLLNREDNFSATYGNLSVTVHPYSKTQGFVVSNHVGPQE